MYDLLENQKDQEKEEQQFEPEEEAQKVYYQKSKVLGKTKEKKILKL